MSGYGGEGEGEFNVFRIFSLYPTSYSGRRPRAEGTGTNGSLLSLIDFLSRNPYPRQNQKKLEDSYDKDEFDNGYSAKISEVTTNDADNVQPNSQLMEKTFIRSERHFDSFWLKDNGKSKCAEEEEIRNVFRSEDEEANDLEVDGDISNQPIPCPNCNSTKCMTQKLNALFARNQTGKELISQNKKAMNSNSSEKKFAKQPGISSQQESSDSTMMSKSKPVSSNVSATEGTSSTSLSESKKQFENEVPKQKESIPQINEPNSNRDLKNEKTTQTIPDNTEYVEETKLTTENNSTPRMGRTSSSEENPTEDDSDGVTEDYDDEIDAMLLEEEENDEEYEYTFNNLKKISENLPESIRKVFGEGGVPGKGGRYSKGFGQLANIPTFIESIRKFASDNGLEIEDVIPDGNCMFRAVVDQLYVNGDLGNTPQSLRLKAVRYLRQNPCQSDGSRLEAFLLTETWEQYLLRMEQNSQWGDHMILKAMADAFNLIVVVFNIFEDDIRRTEILPEGTPITKRQRLTIYLGHIGEFHYLSLRERDWEIYWPFKSLIRRYQVFRKTTSLSATKKDIREKIENMGKEQFLMGAELKIPYQAEASDQQSNSLSKPIDILPEQNRTFVRYGLAHLQPQENKESLESLLMDCQGVDALTGLPLPHFSYVINFLLYMQPITSVVHVYKPEFPPEENIHGFHIQMNGASVEDVNICMKDVTKEKKMQYYEDVKILNIATTSMCDMLVNVVYLVDANTDKTLLTLLADCTDTHPGYCRLTPAFPENMVWSGLLYRRNSEVYLQKTSIPSAVQNKQNIFQSKKLGYGYHCNRFPKSARRWHSRQKKCKWPSEDMIEEIMSGGCILVQRAHPNSVLPEVEWKFVFSNAEQVLLKKALCQKQKSIFKMFKVTAEYLTRHLEKTLKHKHLKNVFFYACENIERKVWEQNIGGCLLYIFAYLLDCLKKQNIPHYFIPENNLIDYYSEKEIQTIATYIEAFRVLPIHCLGNMYKRYGWKNVFTPSLAVLKDCKQYSETRDIRHAWLNVFLPASLKMATSVVDFFGLYDGAYDLICKAYEDLKQSPLTETPSFDQVFQDSLKFVKTSACREALVKLHNKKCGRNVTNNNQKSKTRQTMNISEVLPFSVDERIRDFEIPEMQSKVQTLIIAWLDSKAYEFYMSGKCVMAEVLLQTTIKYIKFLLKKQNEFDVSEIEDKSLQSEVWQERTSLITLLYEEYWHLLEACYGLGSIRSFDEHLSDLENYQHSVEGADELLASVQAFPRRIHPSFHFTGSRDSSLKSLFYM